MEMTSKLENFTDVLGDPDEIGESQPLSLSSVSVENSGQYHASSTVAIASGSNIESDFRTHPNVKRPDKGTGQCGKFRSVEEVDVKYRNVFSYPFFNLVQSRVIEDALYSDKSMVICAPTGSGKTVVFEMAIVRLLMELEDKGETHDFKIIYIAPVKALCTERLTEWYSKFTKLGLLCIEVTGDTDVDFSQLKPYRIIVTTPEKWDMLTRRWRDHRQLVEVIKLFLIDEVHILNDESRGPVLEAVVSRMKTIETSVQSTHRIELLQQQYLGTAMTRNVSPSIRFVAVSATVSNPEDVATWLGTSDKPAVYYKFGDECRPVKLRRVVEGYHCAEGTSIFKFDLVLNYKLWPIIQKYHDGKPTLIFCNTRKSVAMTAETLSREITISFNEQQRARLTALASTIKNKKLQTLVLSGVGCHHAGLLYEERNNIEQAFRNRDLPILITTTTLAMGVNLPAHLVIIKNTQQYVSGAYQEYSISTVLQMVGRAGRPQFDTEATAVIMTRMCDKPRYQALVGGSEPLQSYLHKRLPENLNSEAALGTVSDVAQCVQWLRSTFLSVRAAQDPKRYLGLPPSAPHHHIAKKIEELCVKAMNGLASSGLITMDEACCIESTEAGRLMSIFYLDLETMKHIMKIEGSESLERLLWIVCESHELSDMHLRMDERRCLNALNRNNSASVIRFPMKGKITTRQMKLNCVIQAILGCLPIPDPSLNQEATKIMRTADRVCKCLVAYVTRPALVSQQPKYFTAVLNSIILAKCVAANLWENSPFVCKQLKGIGPTFSTLLATAGKVNFMLLEESHPRDLERIMNKGPPAGNILRKQISLFPKYQLTMTPVDEKVVSIQLVLLNHHNLSENMEHLTAGAAHKSYMIIGDSENNLLLLTSFSDKDLIGVYDGSMAYQITRKHGFEHKIYAHCVSSTFAGIDAQCEYIFKDVDPQMYPKQPENSDDLIRKPVTKQTTITDTFRERKRKNTDGEIAQSKEKKKRESALFEKFKNLKESFGKTSKVLKKDLDKSAVMSQKMLQELTHLEKDVPNAFHSTNDTKNNNTNNELVKSTFFEEPTTYEINDDDFVDDAFMNEDKINDILNEIESEITSKSDLCDKKKSIAGNENNFAGQKTTISRSVINANISNKYAQIDNFNKTMNNRKRVHKNIPKKSNYNFIDLLEKDIDLSDTEETSVQEHNSFSDTIRSHIEKYLQKTQTNLKPPNRILDPISEEPVPSKEIEPIVHDSNLSGKDDNIGELGETMRLRSNSVNYENVLIPEEDKELTEDTFDQVTLLGHQIKSFGLTVDQLHNTDCHNLQEVKENELPAVILHQNISKNDDNIAIDNVEKAMERRIIPEYTYASTCSNKNIEIVRQSFRTINTINYKNDNVDNLNFNIQKQESVLDEDVLDRFDPGKNYSNIDEDKTRVGIPSNIPLLAEKLRLAGIEEPNQIDNLLKVAQNENAYNDLLPTSINIPTITEQNLYDNTPLGLPSTSYLPQIKEKHDLHTLEMWKNYLKKLPRLSLEQNNKEITAYNNPMIYDDIDNQNTSTKQVDIYQEQPMSQFPDVKGIQKNTAIVKSKNKGLGFIPPYKHPVLEIEPAINNCTQNREKVPSEATGALRQLTHIPQKHKQPLVLSKIASIAELQNKLSTIEQTHNSRTTAIQNSPAHTQLHYENDKLKFLLPSTKRFTSEYQEQEPLDNQSTTSIDQDVATFNNPTVCAIGNRLNFTEQNYDPINKNNKEHYINKYSFTSTKTDVLTQQSADRVVHVIKNLRIDLDITEIVSKDKKPMDYYSGADIEGQIDMIDRNEESLNFIFKTATPANDQSIEQCYRNIRDMQPANYNSRFGNGTKPLDQNNAKTLASSDYLPAVSKSSETQTFQPLPANKHVLSRGLENGEVIQMDKDNEEDVNTYNKYKIEDCSKENKPNNVMGILQKYSNIMRNNSRNSAETQTQIKVTEKTSSVPKTAKSKRPFKISDIDRLNPAPLPSLLNESAKPLNISECFNLLEPHDKLAQLERNKQLNIISDLTSRKEPLVDHKYNEDPEVAENESINANLEDISYSDPYIEGLEVKDTVTNIDQTMFNPKTLLQCFSTEDPEDIVPPPPEFSDFMDASITSGDVNLPADSYEPMAWEEVTDEHHQEVHNISIFQDDSQVELTPSKEIETWNLSQDGGSWEKYVSPGLSPYSFTIIRKNKEQSYPKPLAGTLLHNMNLPRHKMLQQFKFNNKNKYKM